MSEPLPPPPRKKRPARAQSPLLTFRSPLAGSVNSLRMWASFSGLGASAGGGGILSVRTINGRPPGNLTKDNTSTSLENAGSVWVGGGAIPGCSGKGPRYRTTQRFGESFFWISDGHSSAPTRWERERQEGVLRVCERSCVHRHRGRSNGRGRRRALECRFGMRENLLQCQHCE